MASKQIYFAYGSNLCKKRMHRSNPNAVRRGKAVLNDFRLDFGSYSKFWYGSGATIIPKEGETVWGALWELEEKDFANLDYQEGVHLQVYRPIFVEVETPEGEFLICRSYQIIEKNEEEDLTNLPYYRRPTPAYMDIIIRGAIETGLPIEYVNFLTTISTNGIEYAPDLSPVNDKLKSNL